MGGRFGKYGDAKRKAQIRKNRLRPHDPKLSIGENCCEAEHHFIGSGQGDHLRGIHLRAHTPSKGLGLT